MKLCDHAAQSTQTTWISSMEPLLHDFRRIPKLIWQPLRILYKVVVFVRKQQLTSMMVIYMIYQKSFIYILYLVNVVANYIFFMAICFGTLTLIKYVQMNSVCFQSIVGHYLVHFDDIQSGDFSTSPVPCYRFYYDGYQYWLWCLGIVRCCSCCIFSFP